MTNVNEDLLQPTLGDRTHKSLYSIGALTIAAFLGGAPAALVMVSLNSRRIGRIWKDAFWLVSALLVFVVALFFVLQSYPEPPGRDIRIASRLLGFGVIGAFYMLHRSYYRSMSAFGIEPPSPYLPVFAACVFSFVLLFIVIFVARI